MNNDTVYDANVRVRELPRSVDQILNALAALHGKLKHEIVKDALMEYAEHHKHEIATMVANG